MSEIKRIDCKIVLSTRSVASASNDVMTKRKLVECIVFFYLTELRYEITRLASFQMSVIMTMYNLDDSVRRCFASILNRRVRCFHFYFYTYIFFAYILKFYCLSLSQVKIISVLVRLLIFYLISSSRCALSLCKHSEPSICINSLAHCIAWNSIGISSRIFVFH